MPDGKSFDDKKITNIYVALKCDATANSCTMFFHFAAD